MNTDITYCADFKDCPAYERCLRADWPVGSTLSMADFWNACGDEDLGVCEHFICNCSDVKFIGSNRHGSYYKCRVCGEESEG